MNGYWVVQKKLTAHLACQISFTKEAKLWMIRNFRHIYEQGHHSVSFLSWSLQPEHKEKRNSPMLYIKTPRVPRPESVA